MAGVIKSRHIGCLTQAEASECKIESQETRGALRRHRFVGAGVKYASRTR